MAGNADLDCGLIWVCSACLGSSVLILSFFVERRDGCVSILDNEFISCMFLLLLLLFLCWAHGRLVFAKCVLPSVNKVYYYYYYSIIIFKTQNCFFFFFFFHRQIPGL